MLNIILGPAGAGQSEILCRKMVGSSVAHPSSFIAIVPEQSTLKMQRDAVAAHPNHSAMNIDVVSFERLAHRVFEEQGIEESDILDDTGKVLLLRKVLEELKDDLTVYRRKVHMPGFAAEIKSVITELKQYDIDDNGLFLMQEKAGEKGNTLLYDKLGDIRLILEKYNEAFREAYTTREELMDVFAGLIKDSEMIRGAGIYLDGFTGFTPVQYRIIGELMKYAGDITVSLLLPPDRISENDDSLSMFSLSNVTFRKLKEKAAETGTEVSIEQVAHDQKKLDTVICCFPDVYSEVRYIVSEILDGVIKEGKRFRDFACICSDMELYSNIIRDIFREAQVPCFIDCKNDLGSNMLARAVICAMNIVRGRFSADSVLAFLRSGMTDISPDDIDILENYCLEFGINGYGSFSSEFSRNRMLMAKRPDGEPDYFYDLERINTLREQVMDSLSAFYTGCRGSERTAGVYSGSLKRLLVKIKAEKRVLALSAGFYEENEMSEAKEYEQIYGLITDLLDQISGLMADEEISPGEYLNILTGALEEIKVSIIPPSLDAVVIGDLVRTRLDNINVLFIAGVNDGKMPLVSGSAGIITRKDREFLREEHFEIAPAPLEELYIQHFYIYMLLAKPSERLHITYPLADTEGEELQPSYILAELKEMMPGLNIISPEPKNVIWKALAAGRLSEAVKNFEKDSDEDAVLPYDDRKLLRYFAQAEPETLRQIMSGAFYTNKALPIDRQTVMDLYGEKLTGSASRYEQYYECPFRQFLNYGLNIKERPEYEVRAADIGTIYHNSLELYSAGLKEKGLSFRNVSDEESHKLIRECMVEAASSMESGVVTSTLRNEFMLKRMMTVAEKTTDVLRQQVRQGLYEPELFEFSFKEELDGSAAFKGKIDRVDIYDGDDVYVKVIDYKSGNKRFSIRDIYTGRQMQLSAYLIAAVKKTQQDHPGRNVKVGGVYYYLIQDRFVRDEKDAAKKFRMSGVTACDDEAVRAIDTELVPGTGSSIAEISLTGSGIDQRSNAANQQELKNLMRFTAEKISCAGQEIGEGNVSISPAYEKADKNACTYCEYKNVCKFEPGRWGSDYNRLPDDMTEAQMEKEIYGRS